MESPLSTSVERVNRSHNAQLNQGLLPRHAALNAKDYKPMLDIVAEPVPDQTEFLYLSYTPTVTQQSPTTIKLWNTLTCAQIACIMIT
jgi:hypothetical protein